MTKDFTSAYLEIAVLMRCSLMEIFSILKDIIFDVSAVVLPPLEIIPG